MAEPTRNKVQWTLAAKEKLAELPLKIRRAILEKTGALAVCADPRKAHKPLDGPLRGYYSIKVSRFRAVYTVHEQRAASGETILLVRVVIVAVGMRKEGDKHDVYKLAEKLVALAARYPDNAAYILRNVPAAAAGLTALAAAPRHLLEIT